MKRSLIICLALGWLVAAMMACSGDENGAVEEVDVGGEDVVEDTWMPPEGTVMRFEPGGSEFFDVPFPDDVRRGESFQGVFSSWPETERQPLLEVWFNAGDDLLEGWGLSSAIFSYFSDPIDASTLPVDVDASVDFESGAPSVFLVDVDKESDYRGEVLPITCQLRDDAGSYHDANQLGCITPFGVLRRPATRYALVVTNKVLDVDGEAVVADEAMARLLRGEDLIVDDQSISAEPYQDSLDVIADLGVDAEDVASLVVFTTHDPSQRLRRINAWYNERPTPMIDDEAGLAIFETYDDFVVLEGYYDVPVIQKGSRPYDLPPEGEILFDEDGDPKLVEEQSIRFYLTVPRMEMSEDGFPVLFYLHGSGGVAEELLHRGARPDENTLPDDGTGPGGVVAPYGIAGFAADFNLHGMRHSPPDSTGLKLYNLISNPRAAVDNFIIAANEVTLHARLVEALEFDVADVDGLADLLPESVEDIRFDNRGFAAMGQSMGSTIGLPALTVDTTIGAGIFSGSGGVLIEVALESTKPIDVGQLLRLALNYQSSEELDEYDPILSAVQHVWDIVEPVSHGRYLIDEPHEGVEPTHALQHSGLDDNYFSPRSRAAFSMALGAEVVEPVFEAEAFEQMRWLDLDGAISVPASGNRNGTTAVVTQYEPSVLDGHNVAYQRDDAQAQYACFIRSLALEGVPVLRSAEDSSPENCLVD